MALIWGSSFLFIELSLELTTALGVAFWRTLLGGLAMLVLIAFLKIKLPKKFQHYLHLWVAGLLMSAFPFSMYAFAQQQTTSILASIMNATTPLFTLLAILTIFRSQRQSSVAIIGLLVGLIGVGVTLGVWQGFGENDQLAILALVAASISYGIGTPYIRRFVTPLEIPATSAAAVQVTTSAITLLPFYVLTGPLFIAEPRLETVGALLLLGMLGSGIAYALFYDVVAQAGSTVAATVTYTNPVIATFWGILLLGEPLHWYEPVGGILVLLGAYLSQGKLFGVRKS
jgi:drug/metabolite transporter (DMT)-like permease